MPKLLFEGKTIQRMEILVLNSLNWKIKAYTPCNFIDYYLRKMNEGELPLGPVISRSLRLISSTFEGGSFVKSTPLDPVYMKMYCIVLFCLIEWFGWMGELNAAGIEFLEFKPSEIAAAVAMCVSGEMQAMDIDKAFSCLIGVDKVGACWCLVPPS